MAVNRTFGIVVGAFALVLLAWSPLGEAAGRSVATFARNAGAVNGIKASRKPVPGRLVPLGRNGKFPRSVVPTVRGAHGADGAQGPQGTDDAADLLPFLGVDDVDEHVRRAPRHEPHEVKGVGCRLPRVVIRIDEACL